MQHADILLHLAEHEPVAFDGGSPTLYQTSNFLFDTAENMRHALINEDTVPFYTRGTNPTVQLLQRKVAALEGMDDALVLSSGSAAVATAVLGLVKAGDHILSVAKPYSWTAKLLGSLLPPFGVTYTLADARDTEAFLAQVTPRTKLIFLESPNSWTFEMQDMEPIAAFARERGILTLMDNSYASPLNQQPAAYGIDLVAHSATKYLNGHSDLVAGVLCGSRDLIQTLFKSTYMTLGACISPYEAWLMLRSLRTLPLRMKHIGETTRAVVDALEGHAKIRRIYYPHAASYDQPELTKKYLKGPGGLFSIDLKTTEHTQILAFANSLRKFKLGCSWGSYESLAFPAITTMTSLNYDNPNIVAERVRLSVGLDEPQDLIDDLMAALELA